MDAFAVSVAAGVALRQLRVRHALTIAGWFGSFQAIMPVLGWLGGRGAKDLIAGVDHWIASGLLFFIGCKMIYEAVKIRSVENIADPLNAGTLFVLAVATSIDALAVGLSFAMLNFSIVGAVLTIGVITFVISFVGVWIGARIGHFFERTAAIAGGVILVGIGLKILLAHLG